MKVLDPTGQAWRVHRRWMPWRLRLVGPARRQLGRLTDLGDVDDGPVVLIGIIVFVAKAVPFLVVAPFAAVELAAAVVAAPFALLGRTLLGRPWAVLLRRGLLTIWTETTAGDWQASGMRLQAVADDVRRGHLPPRSVDAHLERVRPDASVGPAHAPGTGPGLTAG